MPAQKQRGEIVPFEQGSDPSGFFLQFVPKFDGLKRILLLLDLVRHVPKLSWSEICPGGIGLAVRGDGIRP